MSPTINIVFTLFGIYYRSALITLHNTARADGYSASDLFYRWRLRSTLLDIDRDIDFVQGQKSRSRTHQIMRENMRSGSVSPPFKIGDIVHVKKEVGSKKGTYTGHYKITHIRPQAKSYFVRDLETGRTYLRGLDRIKLDSNYINPQIEAMSVTLICP